MRPTTTFSVNTASAQTPFYDPDQDCEYEYEYEQYESSDSSEVLHTEDEGIQGMKAPEMNTPKTHDMQYRFSLKEGSHSGKPIWIEFRALLHKTLKRLHQQWLGNNKSGTESVSKSFESLDTIIRNTINPAILKIMVENTLRGLQKQHPIWTWFSWRMESRLMQGIRQVLERAEFNETALYYSYNNMIEGLLKEKENEIRHLAHELKSHTAGSRTEEITKAYYDLCEENKKLHAHLHKIQSEVETLKAENEAKQSALEELKPVVDGTSLVIQNLTAEMTEYMRANERLENELGRMLEENNALKMELNRLRQENTALKAECEEKDATIIRQQEALDRILVRKWEREGEIQKGLHELPEFKALQQDNIRLEEMTLTQIEEISGLKQDVQRLTHTRREQMRQIQALQSLLNSNGVLKNAGVGEMLLIKIKGIFDLMTDTKEDKNDLEKEKNKNVLKIKYTR